MPDFPVLRGVTELQEAPALVVPPVKMVPWDKEVLRDFQEEVETQELMEPPASVEPRVTRELVVYQEARDDPVPVALELKVTRECPDDLNVSRERPVPRELPEPPDRQDETDFPEERETVGRLDVVEQRETPARMAKEDGTELMDSPAVMAAEEAKETVVRMVPRETPVLPVSEEPLDLEGPLDFQETRQPLLQEKMEPQETTVEQETPVCQELKETLGSPAKTESREAQDSKVAKERRDLLDLQDTEPPEAREKEAALEREAERGNRVF
jgi:hypothetical protein